MKRTSWLPLPLILAFSFIGFVLSPMESQIPTTRTRTGDIIPRTSARYDGLIWNSSWGNPDYLDEAIGVWCNSTTVFTCGKTYGYGAGSDDLLVSRWNVDDGSLVWNKTWGGTDSDIGRDVWSDGLFVYTSGWTSSFAGDGIFVVKWNATTGDQVWNVTKTFTWGGYSIFGEDSSLFVCGNIVDNAMVMKIDKGNGSTVWTNTWGNGARPCVFNDGWTDGDSVFTLGLNDSGGYPNTIILVKWNASTGAQLWNTTWTGMVVSQEGPSIWGDGDALYCLTTKYLGSISELALIKWNATDGHQLWNTTSLLFVRSFGTAIWGNPGSIFTTGFGNMGTLGNELLLSKWNATTGACTWTHNWGYEGKDDRGYGIYGNDSAIYTCGSTEYPLYGDLVLLKWNAAGGHPIANFTANCTQSIAGENVTFTSTSESSDSIAFYQWDFGDGSVNATGAAPAHIYQTPGTYNITLSVVDGDGDVDSERKDAFITIIPDLVPVASFTVSIDGHAATFTFNGTAGNGITDYQWNFGPGNAWSAVPSIEFTYYSSGTYLVILTVTDVDGDVDTCSANITIQGTQPLDYPDDSAFILVSVIVGAIVLIPIIIVFAKKGKERETLFPPLYAGSKPEETNRPMEEVEFPGAEIEHERLERLEKIMAAANRIEVSRLAMLLEMDEELLWNKLIEWAPKFGFVIDKDVLIFEKGDTTAFLNELDKQFKEWDRNEKGKEGKS
nr:PKD domain-containing protein [Candidatus Sigynarchaeota archaeon]